MNRTIAMKPLRIVKTALGSLRANAGRSFLTILGIVIGVFAIVLVMALGEGAQGLILGQVQGLGSNMITINAGREPEGIMDMMTSLYADSLKERDIEALKKKENVPYLKSIAPAVVVPGPVIYQDQAFNSTNLGWSARDFVEFFEIETTEGRYFTDSEIDERTKIAVIGYKVREELFGNSDALNEIIKIKGHNFRIVGLLPKKGQVGPFDADRIVLIPYLTAQKDILGVDYYMEVHTRAVSEEYVAQTVDDIKATLREMHGIADGEKDDFMITTQQDTMDRVKTVTATMTVFLMMIAAISLLVGGIGIMNIMLVSVTERTREIGLRKALGATNGEILRQFLFEAVFLTVGGGLIGTLGAVLSAALTAYILRTGFDLAWPFSLPASAIVIGIGTAVAIGLVFGIFPARAAARKDPIDSLRYE